MNMIRFRSKTDDKSIAPTGVIRAGIIGGGAFFAARFAANTMRAANRLRGLQAVEENLSHVKFKKPPEPDFSAEEGD